MPETKTSSYAYQEQEKIMRKVDEITSSLPQCCHNFLYDKVYGPKEMRPKTALAYAGDLGTFFFYLSVSNPILKDVATSEISPEFLGNLTKEDIEDYYRFLASYSRNGKTYTNATAAKKRKINSLSAFYKYLISKGYFEVNPCLLIDTGKIHQKPIIHLAADEQNRLIDEVEYSPNTTSERSKKIKENYTQARDLAILYMFLGTGMRVSELVGLNMDDLDLQHNTVSITRKGGKLMNLCFGNDVAGVVRDYVETTRPKMLPEARGEHVVDQDALFLSVQKRRISTRQVETIIKGAAVASLGKAGERISCHKLRSTFATELYRGTGNIALVAEQLGHNDINTTRRRYADVQDLESVPEYVSVKR